MADRPYDDSISGDDEKLLKDFMEQPGQEAPPPANDEGPDAVLQAEVDAGLRNADGSLKEPAKEPAKEPDDKDKKEPAAEEGKDKKEPDDDAEMAAFLEKHKDKTPEELRSLLWQQGKRAKGAEARARHTQTELDGLATAAADRLKGRKGAVAAKRAALDKDFGAEGDPDKVTRRLAEEALDREEAEAEAEEHIARVDIAIKMAGTAIPNFVERHRANAYNFGRSMNYSQDELSAIDDGRDLVTLHFASVAARMLMAGIIDAEGNIIAAPKPLADEHEITDPRLKAPDAPDTLSSAPGRGGGGGKSQAQTLTDALNMSDADFAKLSDTDIARMTEGA